MTKTQKNMTLWHVSSKENIDSIFRQGIDPCYSRGKRPVSWYVKWYGLLWAILHISYQKRIPVWELAVFRVHARSHYFTHFNRNVYITRKVLRPSIAMSAELAVSKIEHQRGYVAGRK